jgi:hypothetical protein
MMEGMMCYELPPPTVNGEMVLLMPESTWYMAVYLDNALGMYLAWVKCPSPSPPPGLGDVAEALRSLCPAYISEKTPCPACLLASGGIAYLAYGSIAISVGQQIVHLNDFHRWTREEIADWLEGLDVDLTIKKPEPEKEQECLPPPKFTGLDEMLNMMPWLIEPPTHPLPKTLFLSLVNS